MAFTMKKLYGGTLTATSATLITGHATLKTLVKDIILCNKTSTAVTVTIAIDGINILFGVPIDANSTKVVGLSSVIEPTKLLTGLASLASSIDVYISGLEG